MSIIAPQPILIHAITIITNARGYIRSTELGELIRNLSNHRDGYKGLKLQVRLGDANAQDLSFEFESKTPWSKLIDTPFESIPQQKPPCAIHRIVMLNDHPPIENVAATFRELARTPKVIGFLEENGALHRMALMGLTAGGPLDCLAHGELYTWEREGAPKESNWRQEWRNTPQSMTTTHN